MGNGRAMASKSSLRAPIRQSAGRPTVSFGMALACKSMPPGPPLQSASRFNEYLWHFQAASCPGGQLLHKVQGFDCPIPGGGQEVHYIFMGTSPTAVPRQVGILVLDNDPHGASAVKQILDSERWRVRVVPDAKML